MGLLHQSNIYIKWDKYLNQQTLFEEHCLLGYILWIGLSLWCDVKYSKSDIRSRNSYLEYIVGRSPLIWLHLNMKLAHFDNQFNAVGYISEVFINHTSRPNNVLILMWSDVTDKLRTLFNIHCMKTFNISWHRIMMKNWVFVLYMI